MIELTKVPPLCSGKRTYVSGGIHRYATAAAVLEDPIKPPVTVQYDKLLINGQFVDAASGELSTVRKAAL